MNIDDILYHIWRPQIQVQLGFNSEEMSILDEWCKDNRERRISHQGHDVVQGEVITEGTDTEPVGNSPSPTSLPEIWAPPSS